MRLPSKREWALIAVVPALILAAAAADKSSQDKTMTIAEARPAGKTKTEGGRIAEADELDLTQLRREGDVGEPANVFESKSWYVPPPPPPPAPVVKAVPAPPTAPPLPFTFLGQYQDTGKPVFFLMKGDNMLTVKEGDVIESIYRVDGIAGSALGLTYVPLDIKQTLELGTGPAGSSSPPPQRSGTVDESRL